ncbi:MAG TPA: DUF294 nucleotidyltransferase-like domain-containing protein [Thiobacillaceae bacterium]|nr:DUF294 nucleotidyltransferase-like domain-containing protein [Thiobacillaceae bacterium]HNU63878.1 DUF294 nucleotidyltransferase-like domain-containing protein [Thiobacillaceae bacterium]
MHLSPPRALEPATPDGPESSSLQTPLAGLIRRPPVTCAPDTPLRAALEIIQTQGISAIVVAQDGHPLGIFSVRDLIGRVLLPGLDLGVPVRQVMTASPAALAPSDHAFEAAVLMARGDFRHVLVVQNGQLMGVLSERDLFALQRVGVTGIASRIQHARGLEPLRAAAGDIRSLAHNLSLQGATAEQLTHLISKLNDLLTARIIELERARQPAADAQVFCWLALGSEGRLEQTLHTDQDNGILFEPCPGQTAEAARAALLPFARAVNEALAACGFPLCKGGVMASNPKWCLSLEEWQDTFGDWIFRGDAPVLLNASIFFDFRPLTGETRLARALRQWLHEHVRQHRQFLRLMTQNALGNRPPLGLIRDFVVDGSGDETGTIDLKLRGTMPFVDAARIFALAAGVEETGTAARLRAAGTTWKLDPREVAAWVDGFFHIQHLRLRLHQEQITRQQPFSNRLDPTTLSAVERQTLKASLRQAKKLRARMESFFQF